MRHLCGLLMVCVVLAGCKPVEYEIQDNQIRVSGASAQEIESMFTQLFNTYHWTGRSNSYSSVTSTINFKTTKENKRTLSAITDDGKPFSVEILEKNDDPVLVTLHCSPESRYSQQSLTRMITEKMDSVGKVTATTTYPKIQIADLVRKEGEMSFSGTWTAQGDWKLDQVMVNFEIQQDNNRRSFYSVQRQDIPEFNAVASAEQLPLDFTVTMSAGKMVFSGNREAILDSAASVPGGSVVLEINPDYIKQMEACVKDPITGEDMVGLLFSPLDSASCQRINQAMGAKQKLSDLRRLKNYNLDPSYIEKIYAAGYPFGVDDLIRAQNYQMSPEFMAEFKTAGYNFNLNELIRIKNYQLKAETFKTFKDAGYDFSIDEQIRAQNYQIPASFAAELKKMGCNYSLDELIRLRNYQISSAYIGSFKKLGCDYSIDELIRLQNYQITPAYVEAFQGTGRKLSIDEMIRARNYQIRPEDIKKYAEAGYTFSLEELIKLRNNNIQADYILGLRQEGYENFTADELVRFRQRNLSVEDIRKIRTEKKVPAEQTPSQIN